MKRLLLLMLAAIPLFAFSVNFIFCDYDYDDEDYWYDEYWEDEYRYDGYWLYYPHGYYCVHYVWWYPWWWDWYWYRCHWVHHFSWDFFYSGFYVVWYNNGCWWYRPRYGRYVRYRLPYTYYEVRYRAKQHGIYLPKKAPREINVPYKASRIMTLAKQKDPKLFSRIEKEHKSGNLEKMKKQYTTKVEKDIAKKNQEYKIKSSKTKYEKSTNIKKYDSYAPTKYSGEKSTEKHTTTYSTKKDYYQGKSKSYTTKKDKSNSELNRKSYQDDDKKLIKKENKDEKSNGKKYEYKKESVFRDKYSKSPNYQKSKQIYNTKDRKTYESYPSRKKR